MFKATAQNVGRSPRKRAKKSSNTADPNGDLNASALFAKSDKSSMEVRLDSYKEIWAATKKKSEVSKRHKHFQLLSYETDSFFFQEITEESHKQLLHDIKTFVMENADVGQSSIPTALVSLGVNLPGM